MYQNIEKSVIAGDYVGYGNGFVWHITRSRSGWRAWQNLRVHADIQPHQLRCVTGRTLRDISVQIAN